MSKKDINARAYSFASFYRFTSIKNPLIDKEDLEKLANKYSIIGLIILANEGINGTIAGSSNAVRAFAEHTSNRYNINVGDIKFSSASLKREPYRRFKVKLRREIVTMGIEDLLQPPVESRGTYVEAEQWNELISDPEVLCIDARNVYEYRLGSFKGATDPKTHNFREFPKSVQRLIGERKPKKVAMFCTGGIRCEKASAYVRDLGVDEVYHLRGGILRYLETIPKEQSLWQGACFVFDGRITLDHQLTAKPEPLCSICGQVMVKNSDGNYECMQCIEYPPQKARENLMNAKLSVKKLG